MLEVTESALKELDTYFADKEKSPIRIFIAAGGWSGPRLGLALDEAGNNDEVMEQGGYTFVIEKKLAQQGTYFKIDFSYMGFYIDSDMPLFDGGSCSTSCSTGGCGGH